MNEFSAFVYGNNLYTRSGGIIDITKVKVDSNTGRFLYTLNQDSRDITDTLNSDEKAVLYQSSPSYQFNSIIAENKHGIQPYQWVLIGGAFILLTVLILRRN